MKNLAFQGCVHETLLGTVIRTVLILDPLPSSKNTFSQPFIKICEREVVRIDSTVEPRYVELGYLELPAISNRIGFPLDLPLFH